MLDLTVAFLTEGLLDYLPRILSNFLSLVVQSVGKRKRLEHNGCRTGVEHRDASRGAARGYNTMESPMRIWRQYHYLQYMARHGAYFMLHRQPSCFPSWMADRLVLLAQLSISDRSLSNQRRKNNMFSCKDSAAESNYPLCG